MLERLSRLIGGTDADDGAVISSRSDAMPVAVDFSPRKLRPACSRRVATSAQSRSGAEQTSLRDGRRVRWVRGLKSTATGTRSLRDQQTKVPPSATLPPHLRANPVAVAAAGLTRGQSRSKSPTTNHLTTPHAWEPGGRGGGVRDKWRQGFGRAAASLPVGTALALGSGASRVHSELRTPNTELRTSNFELRTPNTEHRTPNSEHRTPNTELRTQH
jgi:hypothetical protein